MSSWFSERVTKLVREGPQVPDALRGLAQIPSQPRSADDLASELEKEARRVSAPQDAIDLVSRWLERIESCQTCFPLPSGASGRSSEDGGTTGAAEPLSFYEALIAKQRFRGVA
eukprot:CAMPEP_0117612324 /NCGR_PEP_ID=MMETSP0784-20121206/82892_1 /TAXON_ID=39447 /ORGANISM="" /LENGTH=113 /DNA_ID=CAMNT_0005415879 /DNA_START=77 /DNA_END=418 /DNA_ORIENTATION=-